MSTSKTVVQKIGQYIKYQREKRQMTLAEFAKVLDLDPSFLLRVEKGYYQSVSFDATEKIAKGLGMTLEAFLAKCNITPANCALPTFEYYFKEMYQFPAHAITEIKQYVEFMESKYKSEILALRKKHDQYWKRRQKTTA